MNVGVYFDLRNAPGWRQDPARLYGYTLELCEEAERLGAHSVWLSEHHLFDDGYLPQPLTFAAAVANCSVPTSRGATDSPTDASASSGRSGSRAG